MERKKVGIGIGVIALLFLIVIILIFGLKDKTYNVTFNTGTNNEIVEVKANDTVSNPSNPTKEGYTFDGWYYNGVKFDFTTKITKDIVLEAKWISNLESFTVTFNTDGGSSINSQTVEDGKTLNVPNSPTKKGYTFVGWYYNGEEFDFNTAITKNITLKAVWKKSSSTETTKYTVTFNTDGGNSINSQTVLKNGKVVKPADPKKDGYTFLGWYYNGSKYDFSSKVTKNITLTAKYTKNPVVVTKYTVTFDTDGGSNVASQTVELGKLATKPADPTKEGYTFVGWYYNGSEYNFATKVTKNITLTAKYTKNPVVVTKYTVTFNTDGGSNVASQTVESGKLATKPADPTKDGYTFLGWYHNGSKYDFSSKVTGNITLTAKYNPVVKMEIVDVPNTTAHQAKLYIVQGTTKVRGTVDVTNSNGVTITKTVEVTGLDIIKGMYNYSNPKVLD